MFNNSYIFQILKKNIIFNKITYIIIISFSLVISILIYLTLKTHYEDLAKERFQSHIHKIIDSIEQRMSMYKNALHAGIGFYQGSGYVTRQEWHNFIKSLNISKNYPGMQGIGFSIMLKPDEVLSLEQEMRIGGFPSFSLKPKGERELYSSILYLEPMDERNIQAIGYDMFSQDTRREAMEAARDTGLASVSGRVTLVQEIDAQIQAGILMYLPLYKKSTKADTNTSCSAPLLGFVYSAFRMDDLMHNIVAEESVLNLKIYDSDNISDGHLLYNSDKTSSYQPKHHSKNTLKFDNRRWYIYFSSTPEFDAAMDSNYPLFITFAGLLIYLFLLFIILFLIKSRDLIKTQMITNLKQEEMLIQQSKFAESGEMISMISHQWRQPISVIIAHLTTLKTRHILGLYEKEEDPLKAFSSDFDQAYEKIGETAEHLCDTINHFRDFYRPDNKEKPVNACDTMTNILEMLNLDKEKINIEFVCEDREVTKLFTFEGELKQVFMCVLNNAVDALEEKSIEDQKIFVSIGSKDEKLTILISDNAGGIPTDIISNIFDAYFSTKDEKNGTGLGLHMAKTIIERHMHGTISAHNSIEHGGAEFKICIPKGLDKDLDS